MPIYLSVNPICQSYPFFFWSLPTVVVECELIQCHQNHPTHQNHPVRVL
jgi:hypothetical protein